MKITRDAAFAHVARAPACSACARAAAQRTTIPSRRRSESAAEVRPPAEHAARNPRRRRRRTRPRPPPAAKRLPPAAGGPKPARAPPRPCVPRRRHQDHRRPRRQDASMQVRCCPRDTMAARSTATASARSSPTSRSSTTRKTDTKTVEYIAGVKLGEVLTPELIDQVRERLLTVGLFKDVNINWEPAVPGGNAGVRLILGAKDKLSWIIAPIFHYSPTATTAAGSPTPSRTRSARTRSSSSSANTPRRRACCSSPGSIRNIRNTPFYYRVDALLRRDDIWEYAAGHIGDPRIERRPTSTPSARAALAGVNFTRQLPLRFAAQDSITTTSSSRSCFNTTTQRRLGHARRRRRAGRRLHQAGALGLGQHVHLRPRLRRAQQRLRRAARPARRRQLPIRRRAGSARARTITCSR